jgi:hypothetical protein
MIRGNTIAEPDAFYHYLMESLPLEPESAKVVRLRGWIAEQITEESDALAQPTAFIAKICRHAQLLGIVDGVGSIHIQTTSDRRLQGQQGQHQPSRSMHYNDCDDCDAKCCWSKKRGGKRFCLCNNVKEPMPEDATFGEKQFVSLNRAYKVLQPTANLKRTTVEQMRAAVRKARKDSKPAVLPVIANDPDLSQAQMKLFSEWLKASAEGEQVTMLSTSSDLFYPDPALATEGFSMLQQCVFCSVTHTPAIPWCALSMGMPAESPLPERSGGCGLSKCDNGFCACDMRAYDNEFRARVRARTELYNIELVQFIALTYRAAAELVNRAVSIALGAVTPSHHLSIHDSLLDSAVHLLNPSDSAERLHTRDAHDDTLAWPIEQVVSELSQAARVRLPELE